MKWATERPTRPGWYFHKGAFLEEVTVEKIERDKMFGDLYTPWDGGEWAGPIPEPEEAV